MLIWSFYQNQRMPRGHQLVVNRLKGTKMMIDCCFDVYIYSTLCQNPTASFSVEHHTSIDDGQELPMGTIEPALCSSILFWGRCVALPHGNLARKTQLKRNMFTQLSGRPLPRLQLMSYTSAAKIQLIPYLYPGPSKPQIRERHNRAFVTLSSAGDKSMGTDVDLFNQ